MRWFRSKLRFGAWCALFALTLQFALSFGHVHVPGAASGKSTLLALADAPSSAIAPAKPAKPVKPIAHDQCAICTVMQIAAAVVPAAGPSLPLPADLSQARLGISVEAALSASPHFSFQARAPPKA